MATPSEPKIDIWNTSYTTNTSYYVAESLLYNKALSTSDCKKVEGIFSMEMGFTI